MHASASGIAQQQTTVYLVSNKSSHLIDYTNPTYSTH